MSSYKLIRSARKCARLAAEFTKADQVFKALMEERYGVHDEMPDPIVEVTQYGSENLKEITLEWLDEMMIKDGHEVNPF